MSELYCNLCRRYSTPDEDSSPVACNTCGEPYQCPDCGFEIDADGSCLREDNGCGRCGDSVLIQALGRR